MSESNLSIEINNLKKSFKNNDVLNIESFSLYDNQKIVINGDNGCGKSTLFKIIKSILIQDSGVVNTYNNNVVLLLSGAGGFYGYLTAYNNIKYYLGLNNIKIKNVKDQLDELVSKLDFEEFLHTTFDKLSLGNKQKCQLIASLLLPSNILLIDEPTIGLDIKSTHTVSEIIKTYEGSAIVVTHDVELIKKLEFDVCKMSNGVIGKLENYEEFLAHNTPHPKYFIKTEENISNIIEKVENGYYVTMDKNICNKIFQEYTVLEFKVES